MGVKEIEITIDKTGQVTFSVSGIKGTGCLEFTQSIEAALGQVTTRELSADYYEKEHSTHISLERQS